MNDQKYSSKRRVLLQLKELNQKHLESNIDKQVNKKNEIRKLYYIYKKLDYKFNIIEHFIKEVEIKSKYEYEDILLLSNYKQLLIAKQFLTEKQLFVYNQIIEKEYVKYSHLVYFENKIGISTIDFAVFYLNNFSINVNWKDVLKANILNNYGQFEYDYFLFYSLYLLVLSLEIGTHKKDNYNHLNQVSFKISKFFKDFSSD